MPLSADDIQHYDENGYLIVPAVLTADEVRLLQAEAARLATPARGHRDANVYEKHNPVIRMSFAAEIDSEAFALLYRLPRLLGCVQQLLGESVYLYQSRISHKVARLGEVWLWHQDYGGWRNDGLPRTGERDILSLSVMIDQSTPDNGCLRVVRCSHLMGALDSRFDDETASYPTHVTDPALMARFAAEGRIVDVVGPPGTLAFMTGLTVHGSEPNRSDAGRRSLFLIYNRTDNRPSGSVRREHKSPYVMNRNPVELAAVDDQALARLARAVATESPA